MKSDPILVSICIITYKREILLKKLIDSLLLQELSEFIFLEIIVVDNDFEGSAKNIVAKFKDTNKIQFKYFIQPQKNISLARNLSVKKASGNFICFIDDDESADKKWIKSFIESLYKFNADGAFGYVEPIFDNAIPEYLRRREYYFTPVGETGTPARFYFTTNAIIKSSLLENEEEPFDPAYGITGGGDPHFFQRIAQKDVKFIVCKEAITYEFTSKERGTTAYIYKRALQGGQSFVRRSLEYNSGPIMKTMILFKAFINVVISIALMGIGLGSKRIKIIGKKKLGSSVGKIRGLFGVYKKIYG